MAIRTRWVGAGTVASTGSSEPRPPRVRLTVSGLRNQSYSALHRSGDQARQRRARGAGRPAQRLAPAVGSSCARPQP